MKTIGIGFVALAAMSATAIAHDPNYDRGWSTYDSEYDVYQDWQPEFRNRAARYRHRYDDDYAHESYRYKRNYKRRYRRGDYEEEFRIGNCEIEREWDDDGGYREEVDCD